MREIRRSLPHSQTAPTVDQIHLLKTCLIDPSLGTIAKTNKL
ncbi:hypothetical protein [Phormidesmis sp. 146-33]